MKRQERTAIQASQNESLGMERIEQAAHSMNNHKASGGFAYKLFDSEIAY